MSDPGRRWRIEPLDVGDRYAAAVGKVGNRFGSDAKDQSADLKPYLDLQKREIRSITGEQLIMANTKLLEVEQMVLGVQLMPEDVYYITGLPTQLEPSDVTIIAIVALVMAFVATLYPAWRAARTAPAEALRYE